MEVATFSWNWTCWKLDPSGGTLRAMDSSGAAPTLRAMDTSDGTPLSRESKKWIKYNNKRFIQIILSSIQEYVTMKEPNGFILPTYGCLLAN
jgi:hypothetical protein